MQIGSLVEALAGPRAGEMGHIEAIADDGTLTVTHLDGSRIRYQAKSVRVTEQVRLPVAAEAPEVASTKTYVSTAEPGMPHSRQARKETPTYSGFRKYFPGAIAEVAKVSFISNEDHNPGEPLHWSRGKSADHLDAADRHLTDYAEGLIRDEQGRSALAQAAWRILAQLQLDVEAEKEAK